MRSVFVGHDWAEDHHDIHIENSEGERLHACRLDDGLEGVRRLHSVLAELADDPSQVVIATETDRGLFITAMIAAGYQVIAINPMSTARYRRTPVNIRCQVRPRRCADPRRGRTPRQPQPPAPRTRQRPC